MICGKHSIYVNMQNFFARKEIIDRSDGELLGDHPEPSPIQGK